MRTIIIAVLALAIGLGGSSFTPVSAQERPYCQSRPVAVYMTTWCGFCRQLRAYLVSRGVSFQEIDIERSGPEAAAIGREGVPVSLTERGWVYGFDVAAMRQKLCIR